MKKLIILLTITVCFLSCSIKEKPEFLRVENIEVVDSNSEFIVYALTSTDYVNRVNNFYAVFYKLYLGQLKEYREDAIVLIENINKKIK